MQQGSLQEEAAPTATGQSLQEEVAGIIRTNGVKAAEQATGLAREQVLRIAAGATVRKGTALVAKTNLERRRAAR